ncbi:MAG TPA: DUF2520 domain-containing protein [Salinimicrobium sp.]|nr:DUF2520 domain-containing protein [Salinimicrobium sp.]
MIKVVILGTGNVATHLFNAFFNSEKAVIIQVYNHQPENLKAFAEKTSTTTSLNSLKKADVYLIALKDDVIEKIAAQLQDLDGIVVHTSGSVGIDVLKKFNRRGVFYPLQTFSKSKEVNFEEAPICLEAGSETDFVTLKKLAESISKNVFPISSEQRKSLHLAAVFVSNFVNHMYVMGEEICKEKMVPFEILQPLIKETANKVTTLKPSEAQTGPAIRKDQKTIDAHFSVLENERQKEIYTLLTKSIQQFHGKEL